MNVKRLKKGGVAFFLSLLASTLLAAGPQILHGHVPAVVAHMTPLGTLPETSNLNLAITLPLRNQAALSNLLSQIYDPASPNYHHYLTPEQFTEEFGPAESDYQAVIDFAKANGLHVTATWPNRQLLDVSGTAGQVERALHLTLNVYRHPTENRNFFAPSEEPSLDLSAPVLHISGLDNFELPRPRLVARRLGTTQNVSGNSGSGPGGAYMGKDFRAAYVPDSSRDGSGQMVGLLEFDGYSASDINDYESQAGLPNIPLQSVLIDGASGGPQDPGGADVEVALDMEVAISMATNLSKLVVYIAPNGRPFEDILNSMVLSNQIKQFSCSWYVPEGTEEPAADQIWEQMAAQGQSFFSASGDSCAYTGLIPFPGDSPYITEVGGTTLSTSGPGGAWSSETVWNWGIEFGSEYNGVGSSGGVSTQYPIPSWQTNISMTANQGSTTRRNTPDVAMTADNVYVRVDNGNYSVGGTSCAAPLWAGFTALVNQQAAASGKSSVGFINPALDAIGSGPSYASDFHDITTGNNTWSGSPSKFYAVTGYDLCTGWGTPAGQKLINDLANPEALVISPTEGFVSTGGVGGPFTVTSDELSLTNYGTNVLTWTLTNTSLWLNVSSEGGTLTPGGPAAVVTVSLNNTASNLTVGTYSATLWFTNVNDGFGQGVSYTLNVIAPPTIASQPTNESVLEGATAIFTVSATGGLPLSYQWQLNGTNLTDGGNILGSQTSNLMVSDVSDADVGTYSVTVTNLAGIAVSSNATLSIVPSPPVITVQPASQTAVVDQTVVFSVDAVGNMPMSYQWSFNGTEIIGATNSVYVLADVQLTNAGTYSVVISNELGSAASSNAVLTVLPCDPPPSGIAAWWPAEGNADDIIGANNGTPNGNLTYANGEVSQAFVFDGYTSYITVPASPSLNIGTGGGLTIECWINPSVTNAISPGGAGGPLIEWDSDDTDGCEFWADADNSLYVNIKDTSGNPHTFQTAGGVINSNTWQHVALTYDESSGQMNMYVNGNVVGSANFGDFAPQTTYPVNLGRRTGEVIGDGDTYAGMMDELSLYNRALSSNEIADIYDAGSGGKCEPPPNPPVIVTQPTNETVAVGETASFSVVASSTGAVALSYQWTFDGANLTGATNAILTLTDVQPSQAGTYAVVVANAYGSTVSSNATLTVYGVPPFITE
ncbi:MAG TPA: immunoglobulin domain-containing protein, partial [Candidatus Sulfotelmatobacter sp.]|nr:immunoglobulin domain-containing protein [Candidatus Sulfotelmatobacter sp.]